MGIVTFNSVRLQIEDSIRKVVHRNYVDLWNVHSVGRGIVQEVALMLHKRKLQLSGDVMRVACRLYEINESLDTFGVAVIFSSSFHDLEKAVGVTYWDFYLREPSREGFQHLRKDRVKKLTSTYAAPQLVFADYDPVPFTTCGLRDQITGAEILDGSLPFSFCPSVPAGAALVLERQRSLYKVSRPLSSQILYENLLGFGLDYTDRALQSARGARDEKVLPSMILVIHSARGSVPLKGVNSIDYELYHETEITGAEE